jgi:DNA-binding response OmpR family regulator
MFILGFMAGESGVDQIQLGPFCLDVNGSPVFRDGADLELRPQAVRVLKALLGRPGQSMDYEKLFKQPRGTTFVSRYSVATTFSEMRKTLEEYGSWIGYRLRVGYSLNKLFAGPLFRQMPTGPDLVIGARDIWCARPTRDV